MKYLSLFSGIEAASVAWHPLGWVPFGFAEIEKFPCQVLSHHYGSNMPGEPYPKNGVPNFGDVKKFKDWPIGAVDLICGGSPCQSFSVAGLRKGMDDPRGNLALTYLAIVDKYKPRWVVYENVPGLLSSNEGRDFGSLIGGLGKLGYGFAYRVLDAQFTRADGYETAVPQRRRRVFVVGYLGDWRIAAAVLFDPEGLRGNPPPRRQAGQGSAENALRSADERGDEGPPASLTHDVAPALVSSGGGVERGGDTRGQDPVIAVRTDGLICADVASILNAAFGDKQGLEDQHINSGAPLFVAHALRGEGFDASEDGTGRGTPIVPVCFNPREDPEVTYDRTGPLGSSSPQAQAVEFDMRGRDGGAQMEKPHHTANIRAASSGSSRSYVAQETERGGVPAFARPAEPDQEKWAVRRLTPRECERLQGFQWQCDSSLPGAWQDSAGRWWSPDYTAIPDSNGKPAADGPRYKALGNSMAVNVMRAIGQRIDLMETLIQAGTIKPEGGNV